MRVKPTSISGAQHTRNSLGGVGGKFSLFSKISQFTRNFIDRTPCIEQAQARVPRNLSC